MEEIAMVMLKPVWKKVRVSESDRKKMNAVLEFLNVEYGERYQLVTHLFGTQYICRLGGVTIFTVGTSSKPSKILPVAISDESPDWIAFPLRSEDEFNALCNKIGINDQSDLESLLDFLTPRSKKS